ncbi:unnamed protein product [Arabidopsis halleri]
MFDERSALKLGEFSLWLVKCVASSRATLFVPSSSCGGAGYVDGLASGGGWFAVFI